VVSGAVFVADKTDPALATVPVANKAIPMADKAILVAVAVVSGLSL
jgi:hypothetical protein